MPDSASVPASSGEPKYTRKHTVKELNDKAREFFLRIADDPELYESYLATIAKFPSYSAMNAVRIHEAAPDAVQVRDMAAWNKLGFRVRREEAGIPITQPEYNAEARKTFFTVKYLYSDSQLTKAAKAPDGYDQDLLEKTFERVEAVAPATREGKYIIGAHFNLGTQLGEGTLPPVELLAVEQVEEACANIKNYVDDVRKSANAFIRAAEGVYEELSFEKAHATNAMLFHELQRPQPPSKPQEESVVFEPKKELASELERDSGLKSVELSEAERRKLRETAPAADLRQEAAQEPPRPKTAVQAKAEPACASKDDRRAVEDRAAENEPDAGEREERVRAEAQEAPTAPEPAKEPVGQPPARKPYPVRRAEQTVRDYGRLTRTPTAKEDAEYARAAEFLAEYESSRQEGAENGEGADLDAQLDAAQAAAKSEREAQSSSGKRSESKEPQSK